jgi:hypothetical protein
MADPPRHPDTAEDGSDLESTAGTPRWVKAFGVIALIIVLLFVIVTLTGRGKHGPGRHTPGGGSNTHTGPPAGVTHEQQP